MVALEIGAHGFRFFRMKHIVHAIPKYWRGRRMVTPEIGVPVNYLLALCEHVGPRLRYRVGKNAGHG
jgi:hypothetical protein